jgi:hypothetical protein
MTAAAFDVFLSHAWVDQSPERVATRPQRGLAPELLRRLQTAGLNVFFDADKVQDGTVISTQATEALANSSVFVVWYSTMYPTRGACRWELTTASRIDSSKRRIFGVNPETTGAHIDGTPLKDTRLASCPDPDDEAAWTKLITRIKEVVAAANGTVFGEFAETSPTWSPSKQGRSVRFTGRLREMWALHEILTAHPLTGQETSVAGAAVMDGMGGAGKTVLALEYAHRYGAAWPGGVVWIKGHGFDHGNPADATPEGRRAALNDELQTLAISLGIDLGFLVPITSPTAQMTALRHAIGGALGGHGPVLWVADDLPPALTAAEVELWSAPGNIEGAKTLVTTRTTEYDSYGLTRLALDQLSADEGDQLLTREHAPADERQRAAAYELVEILGGHALALDVTRAGVTGPSGYSEWLDRLKSETERFVGTLDLLGELAGSLTADHSNSVATTLAMSINRLDTDAQAVLEICACFDSLPIPFDMLDQMLEADHRRLGTTRLGNASLATVGPRETLTLHRLVIHVARVVNGLTPDRLLTQRSVAAEALAESMSVVPTTGVASRHKVQFGLAQSLGLPPAARHTVNRWSGIFLQFSGRFSEAIALFEQVLADRIEILGTQHPDTLTSRANLANSYATVGLIDDAITLQEQVLADRIEILVAYNVHTIDTRANLAISYAMVGRIDDAITLQEQVLADRIAILDTQHPDTLTSRANLANSYATVGRIDDAITLQEQVLSDRIEILGTHHLDTIDARANLAIFHGQAGRAGQAITLMQEAFDLAHSLTEGHLRQIRWQWALNEWLGELALKGVDHEPDQDL